MSPGTCTDPRVRSPANTVVPAMCQNEAETRDITQCPDDEETGPQASAEPEAIREPGGHPCYITSNRRCPGCGRLPGNSEVEPGAVAGEVGLVSVREVDPKAEFVAGLSGQAESPSRLA